MKISQLDTNVLVRFLTADDEALYQKSIEIMQKIENGKLKAIISEAVVMELYFVLTKYHKLPKDSVLEDIKLILSLESIVNSDKQILIEALNLMLYKNIDFVDALLCAKKKALNYEILSFDGGVKNC